MRYVVACTLSMEHQVSGDTSDSELERLKNSGKRKNRKVALKGSAGTREDPLLDQDSLAPEGGRVPPEAASSDDEESERKSNAEESLEEPSTSGSSVDIRLEDGNRSDQYTRVKWNMLLSKEALEDAHLFRASSVSDAHVLRRKGRLKEQDGLIEFIISLHSTHSPFQVSEQSGETGREGQPTNSPKERHAC